MEKLIKWNEGEGSIITVDSGSGNTTLYLGSNDNVGIDREQEINIITKEGMKTTLVVKQIGLREVFTPIDEDFILSDDQTFNVLK